MQLQDKTVLVVDDEKDLCDILAAELADFGARTLLAHSVSQALELLDRAPVDLVISDIRMPGESGVELLEQVRRRFPQVPVILVTGFAGITDTEALARGAKAVILKPYDGEELVRECVRLIGGAIAKRGDLEV